MIVRENTLRGHRPGYESPGAQSRAGVDRWHSHKGNFLVCCAPVGAAGWLTAIQPNSLGLMSDIQALAKAARVRRHACQVCRAKRFYASDNDNTELIRGSACDSREQTDKLFKRLSQGAEVTTPVQACYSS